MKEEEFGWDERKIKVLLKNNVAEKILAILLRSR